MARHRGNWERGRDGKILLPIDKERTRDAYIPMLVMVVIIIALLLMIFYLGGC